MLHSKSCSTQAKKELTFSERELQWPKLEEPTVKVNDRHMFVNRFADLFRHFVFAMILIHGKDLGGEKKNQKKEKTEGKQLTLVSITPCS